jgi:succinyl-diaminopimelate desuccinylase
MPFLGVSAIRSMIRFLEKIESKLYPALDRRETAMPVIPELSRRSTLNINSIHGGQAEIRAAATPRPARWSPIPAA